MHDSYSRDVCTFVVLYGKFDLSTFLLLSCCSKVKGLHGYLFVEFYTSSSVILFATCFSSADYFGSFLDML